jgi:hypothetical protein
MNNPIKAAFPRSTSFIDHYGEGEKALEEAGEHCKLQDLTQPLAEAKS